MQVIQGESDPARKWQTDTWVIQTGCHDLMVSILYIPTFWELWWLSKEASNGEKSGRKHDQRRTCKDILCIERQMMCRPGNAVHVWMHSNAGTDISDLCRHKNIHTLYPSALPAGTETLNMPSLNVRHPINSFPMHFCTYDPVPLHFIIAWTFSPSHSVSLQILPWLPVLSQNSRSNIIRDSSESINEVCTMLMSLVLAADTTKCQ